MLNVYRVRIYPNNNQAQYIAKNIGSCRFVYNEALAYSNEHYEKNKDLPKEQQEKRPSGYDLCHRLVDLKKQYPWLEEVDSQALKQSCMNVDVAYKHFFRRLKQGVNPGFPRFKSKFRGSQAFTATGVCKVDFATKKIKLPKCSWIKSRGLRVFAGRIQRMTITRQPSGKYYCSILVKDKLPDVDIVPVNNQSDIAAVDLGISKLARVESSRNKINVEHPHFIETLHKRLERAQRKLSRKKDKSSNNYKKQKIIVARIHEKISDLRRNYAHHISRDIAMLSDAVVVEDLQVQELMKKLEPVTDEEGNYLPNGRKMQKKWNRMIADASWRTLINMIQYKSQRLGKPVILIDPVAGPNKICHRCGAYNEQVTLDTKKWICGECDTEHDRYRNCLKNLKKMAFEFGTAEQVVKPDANQ